MIDFTALRAIALAATPGKWTRTTDRNDQQTIHSGDEWIALLPHQCVTSIEEQRVKDAVHIAAFAPSRALALLDELDRLRAALGEALDIAQAQGCLHPDESDRVDALRAVQRGEK